MTDDRIQKMIIRQSSLNRAVELLTSEQQISKSSAKISLESIKALTNELEKFIWEITELEEPKKEEKKLVI